MVNFLFSNRINILFQRLASYLVIAKQINIEYFLLLRDYLIVATSIRYNNANSNT